jgi:chromosome segregation ATPase
MLNARQRHYNDLMKKLNFYEEKSKQLERQRKKNKEE